VRDSSFTCVFRESMKKNRQKPAAGFNPLFIYE